MEELTTEQKAQRYDEALVWMQDLYPTMEGAMKEDAKHYFPQLKENKSEKIRKMLIRFFSNEAEYNGSTYGIPDKDILDWLKKQGNNPTPINIDKMVMKYSQTKNSDFGLPVNCMIRAYRQGIIDVLNLSSGIEKQNKQNHANSTKTCEDEQNPTDKIEPKFKVGDTIKCKYDDRQFTIKSVDLDKGTYTYTQEGCGNDIDYADENFELVGLKPAWSEEDAEMVEGLNNCLDELEEKNGWKYVYVKGKKVRLTKVRNWLKFFKNRIRPQRKWSKEDSRILYNVKAYIGYAAGQRGVKDDLFKEANEWLNSLPIGFTYNKNYNEDMVTLLVNELKQIANANNAPKQYQTEINWLKSLRQDWCEANCTTTKQWKPSEQDILLLERIANGKSNPQDFQASLGALIEQLKKLRKK